MSIIVTNEITVPAERGELVAARFAANSQSLKDFDGFEGFQLCRPTDPADDRWLVITHWRDEDAYEAWRSGKDFGASHPKGEKAKGNVDARSVVRHYDVAFAAPGN
ncbi:hypothetical protein BSZ39_03230 [Bowdeniella nasicola]|uniref:ABM domain-containing protein n=1 Tax=Bowdeniella nasicola TaxID=208480 RepID=A0A1Q5Q494_9ACTO|nr:antibiotic biosynthesis monooxygenase family protein [Bowdeniella nasicola]OKL54625.1 hypothetical protein BSZ39_03230 [Bowdeniella nasicola]